VPDAAEVNLNHFASSEVVILPAPHVPTVRVVKLVGKVILGVAIDVPNPILYAPFPVLKEGVTLI